MREANGCQSLLKATARHGRVDEKMFRVGLPKYLLKGLSQFRIAKLILGVLQGLRRNSLARQQQRVRHLTKRQAHSKGGNWKNRRPRKYLTQCFCELTVCHRIG